MNMNKTIGQLLQEARSKSGAEILRGHDILDLCRFDSNTRHMIVFNVLSNESKVGFKGDKMRLFLTANAYQTALEEQKKGCISICNHARVLQGHLIYDQTEHDL